MDYNQIRQQVSGLGNDAALNQWLASTQYTPQQLAQAFPEYGLADIQNRMAAARQPSGIAAIPPQPVAPQVVPPVAQRSAATPATTPPVDPFKAFQTGFGELYQRSDATPAMLMEYIQKHKSDPNFGAKLAALEQQGRFQNIQRLADLGMVKDYQGTEYNPLTILRLAEQIGPMIDTSKISGGVFGTKGESIGFNYDEAKRLLGREVDAPTQVVLDMARQLAKRGVTDIGQLGTAKDLKEIGKVEHQVTRGEDGNYYLQPTEEGQPPVLLTPEQAAKVRTVKQQLTDEAGISAGEVDKFVYDEVIKGTALDELRRKSAPGGLNIFSKLRGARNSNTPFRFGETYTGKGGTEYSIGYDPQTGKPVITTTGFSTSDADKLAPLLMMANFIVPGLGMGALLGSTGIGALAQGTLLNQALSSGIISGLGSVAAGGKFGKGFAGGALGAGLGNLAGGMLPTGMNPQIANAVRGTVGNVARTAVMGGDPKKALLGGIVNNLLGAGLNAAAPNLGLSPAQANLLTGILVPLARSGKINPNDLVRLAMQYGMSQRRGAR